MVYQYRGRSRSKKASLSVRHSKRNYYNGIDYSKRAALEKPDYRAILEYLRELEIEKNKKERLMYFPQSKKVYIRG
jgi:hypothetical protein